MKRGLELALGPLLLGFAAASLGSSALLAVAIGLAVVYGGANHVVAVAQRRVKVTRELGSDEVLEGQPFELGFVVRGLGGLPAGVERLCSCGKWHRIEPGDAAKPVIGRPGRHRFDGSGLRVRDDLGLLSREIEADEPIELLVLPEARPHASGGRQSQRSATGDPEPDGLREYRPGTPISRIHWPSLASGSALQERSFVYDSEQLPLLVVDTSGAPTEAQLAWASRTTASRALGLAQSGGCRVLLPGERVPITVTDPHTSWVPLHRRLAALVLAAPAPAQGIDLSGATMIVAANATEQEAPPLLPLPPGVEAVAA